MENLENTTVLVKNVYDVQESLELSTSLNTTIKELKNIIGMRLPSHPDIKCQRLIYGGKVCEDHSRLSDILNKMDPSVVQTLHLLISKQNGGTILKSRPSQVSSPATSVPSPTPIPIPQSTPVALSDSSSEPSSETQTLPIPSTIQQETSTYSETLPPQPPLTHPQFPTGPVFQQHSTDSMNPYLVQQMLAYQQQMMLIQAMYAQQYAAAQQFPMGYTSFPNATPQTNQTPYVLPGAPVISNTSSTRSTTPTTPTPEVVENRNAAQRQAIEGFMLYVDVKLAIKLIILVFVTGQDGSSSRFWFICAGAIAAYFYLTGIASKVFQLVNGQRQRPLPQDGNGPQPQDIGRNNGGAVWNHQQAFAFIRSLGISTEAGFTRDLMYFIFGFFLSLVPSWRPVQARVPAAQVAAANRHDQM